MKCKTCKSRCAWAGREASEHGKCLVGYTPMTNADRIRAMTDEELAEWMAINTDCFYCKIKDKNICSLDEGTCTEEWLSWLKAPVEEGE